jgi:hypothetical protein
MRASTWPRCPWYRLTPVLIVWTVCGCNQGPAVVKVNGLVTYKGKPVPAVFLNFEPSEGRPSWAVTDQDGRFVLSCFKDEDGALVGHHRVFITVDDEGREELARYREKLISPAELRAILKKYRQNATPLRVEIVQKTQDLEIKLD